MDEIPRVYGAAHDALADLDDWTPEAIEQTIRDLIPTLDVKGKVVFNPIRIAVTGQQVSPGLFESAFVLGRERTLERLAAAQVMLQGAATSG